MSGDKGNEIHENLPQVSDNNPPGETRASSRQPTNRRRKLGTFGGAVLVAGMAFSAAGCAPSPPENPVPPQGGYTEQSFKPRVIPKIETKLVFDGQLNLGDMKDLSLKDAIVDATGNKIDYWVNDGHIPYFTTPEGTKRYFVVVGDTTFMFETDGKSLQEAAKNKDFKQVKWVLQPSGAEQTDRTFDTYTGITSILQLDKNDPMHLIGIGHFERRVPNAPIYAFTAHIGKAESFDGGITWKKVEEIITGDDPDRPGVKATGAGQPTAYYNKKDGFVYIMYTDWAAQKNVQHADQLYLARSKANEDGTLGNIEYLLDDNTFGEMTPGKLKSVIPASADLGYTALASLSFNTKLNKYLAVFESKKGFYTTTSDDLINWDPNPKEVLDLAKNKLGNPNNTSTASAGFVTYPTLMSDDTYPNDQTTGDSGNLYFTFEPDLNTPSDLVGLEFSFDHTIQTSAEPSAANVQIKNESSSIPTEKAASPTPSETPIPEATQEIYNRDIPNVYNGNLNDLKSAATGDPDKVVAKDESGNNVLAKEYIEVVNPGQRVAIEGDVQVLADGKLVNNFDSDGTTGAVTYISVPKDGNQAVAYLIYGGRVHRISDDISEENAKRLVYEYINKMNATYHGKVTEYDVK